jgi:hypothetical protein
MADVHPRWASRADAEAASALALEALAAEVAELLPGSALPDDIRAVADDERRHARLAASLAPASEAPQPLGMPTWRGGHPITATLERAIFLLAAGETFAVATLSAAAAGPLHAHVRPILEAILADERRHAALGWVVVAELASALPPEARPNAALAATRAAGLAAVGAVRSAPEAADPHWGVLDAAQVRARVQPLLEGEVWARLEALSLAALPAATPR